MQALFYTGDLAMELREIAEPELIDGEALVDIHCCGICGSDMHAYHGKDERRRPPLILGHEAVGTVRTGRYAGQRVAINPLLTCGVCEFCTDGRQHLCLERHIISMKRPGAFAQVLAIPERNLWPLADSLDFARATLLEPLAVAVHAIDLARRQADRALAEGRVVVLGGGAIGLLCALVLRHQGVRDLMIAEPNPLRRAALEPVIDAKLYDPRDNPPPPASVDILIDAVGAGATRAVSSALMRNGGWIIHVGLENSEPGLDTRDVTLREIGFMGCYCYNDSDIRAAIALLEHGLCTDWSWLDYRPLSAGPASFLDIHEGRAPPKIVLTM